MRYITRENEHLGFPFVLVGNLSAIGSDASLPLSDYWQAQSLFFVFLFGAFWVYAVIGPRRPVFLQRALLMVPLFIIPNLVTGYFQEARQMLPLGFIIIPSALFYLFEEKHG
jgi:hypothetical protein